MWLNYSAIGLFEHKGTRRRKYFLFHLLRMAGSGIISSYPFRGHFCGIQERFNHRTRTLFLLETVGWAWSEYPFSHAAHPADCDLIQANSFSIEPHHQRWALPCLSSQFIIIILYLNLTQLSSSHSLQTAWDCRFTNLMYSVAPRKINWIKDLIISFFVHPTLHFHPRTHPLSSRRIRSRILSISSVSRPRCRALASIHLA